MDLRMYLGCYYGNNNLLGCVGVVGAQEAQMMRSAYVGFFFVGAIAIVVCGLL